MERKEYLNALLKRDILNYCILQQSSESAEVLADDIYSIIKAELVGNRLKLEIDNLCNATLSVDHIIENGEYVNELPEKMDEKIIEKVNNWFGESLNRDNSYDNLMERLKRHLEQLCWDNGILEISRALYNVMERCRSDKTIYQQWSNEVIDDSELDELKKNAKEITVLENLRSNNYKDVIAYRNALNEYAHARCMKLLYTKRCIDFGKLSSSLYFHTIISKFQFAIERLQQELLSLSAIESNEKWDEEYAEIVPTNFYISNIESISTAKAFKLALFSILSHNGETLRSKGIIEGDELKLFQTQDLSKSVNDIVASINLF